MTEATAGTETSRSAAAARSYLARSWHPVPIPPRTKGPILEGWQDLRVTEETLDHYFNGGAQNIGVLLGPASDGLTDVDLDHAAAVALADGYLPRTNAVFGRPSKRRSHRLYRITGAYTLRCVKYQDPDNEEMLLELRGDAHQTVFPGSTHESGEPITWEVDNKPAEGSEAGLKAACGRLAAATLLVLTAPAKGRHDFLMLLAGALVRRLGAEATIAFLTPLAKYLLADRARAASSEVERMVAGAAEKLEEGKPVPGWPKLLEALGKKRTDKITEWLGIGRDDGGGRPVMWLDPGRTEANVDQAGALLRDIDFAAGIFQRGDAAVVVRFVHDEEKLPGAAERHKARLPSGIPVLRHAEPEHVLLAIERGFKPLRHNLEGAVVPADVSVKLARLVLKNATFLPLARVVRSPTLRRDGSVLETPGYDPASAILYCPSGPFPRVPAHPTQEDAKRALERLKQPFRGFPFEADEDQSVVLAEMLTTALRHLYRAAPGFIHRSKEAGTGKTLMADVAAVIATGTAAANVASSILDDPKELKKVLTTWTLMATPVGLIDNILRGKVIDNAELDRFITVQKLGDRILGGNDALTGGAMTTLVLTGNQITGKGEGTRRFLYADLDAGVERPELRRFNFDALEEAGADRAQLVVDILTIVRAYLLAGRPEVKACGEPFGSFEPWSQWVRYPLAWAGAADPVSSLTKIRSRDDDRTKLGSVLAPLRTAFDEASFYLGEAVAVAGDGTELFAALSDRGVAGSRDGTAISLERLGRYLGKHAGRTVDGLRLVDDYDGHKKKPRYKVQPHVPAEGDGNVRGVQGVGGGSVSNPVDAHAGARTHADTGSATDHPQPPAPPAPPKPGGGERKPKPTKEASPERCAFTLDLFKDVPRGEVSSFYQLLTDPGEALAAITAIADRGEFCGLDLETTGLDPLTDRARLLQLALPGEATLVIDLFRTGGLEALREPLGRLRGVFHNAMFDLGFLRRAGVGLVPDCTMMAFQVLTGTRYCSLKDAARTVLGQALDKDEQVSDWAGELTPEQLRYAAIDAAVLLPLYAALRAKLEETGCLRAYELARDAQLVVTDMRLAGMPFDGAAHAALMEKLTTEHAQLKAKLEDKLGGGSPTSSKDWERWLTHALGGKDNQAYAAWPRTGTKKLSISEDALAIGAHLLPPAKAQVITKGLQPFNVLQKQITAFGKRYPEHVRADGRIHARFEISNTIAGRMSCEEPNLQQVPRDEAFRRLFFAPPGRKFEIVDYGQVEMRIAALLGRDERMLQAIADGIDLHRYTASLLMNKPMEEVSKEERSIAKALGFGMLYGQGKKALRDKCEKELGVVMTETQAEALIRKWLNTFPGCRKWRQEQERQGKKKLSVATPSGRIRRWSSADYEAENGFKSSEAYNFPIQGAAAEVMYAALGRLGPALEGLDAIPIAVVHDEIILESSEADAEEAKRRLEAVMIEGMLEIFPEASTTGLVDGHIGTSWADK